MFEPGFPAVSLSHRLETCLKTNLGKIKHRPKIQPLQTSKLEKFILTIEMFEVKLELLTTVVNIS